MQLFSLRWSSVSTSRAAVVALAAAAAAGASTISGEAMAGVSVPTVEHFSTDAADWHDNGGIADVGWVASGGPDGSSYASTGFNFMNLAPNLPIPGNAVVLFRAQDEFGSSGNAFVGDWLSSGVTELSFSIRHNASTPLNFFARFATPNNSPAWSGVEFAPVAPNAWTTITIPIALSNPNLFFEGPPGAGETQFNSVFGDIGHLQIGAFAAGLGGVDEMVTFDLDQVAIAPTPGALSLMALGLLARRRRRMR